MKTDAADGTFVWSARVHLLPEIEDAGTLEVFSLVTERVGFDGSIKRSPLRTSVFLYYPDQPNIIFPSASRSSEWLLCNP
jgi:hypothetical protein